MAFNLDRFLPLSSMANSAAPRFWTYGTDDTVAVVETAGYFEVPEFYNVALTGDIIFAGMLADRKFYRVVVDRTLGTVTFSSSLAMIEL